MRDFGAQDKCNSLKIASRQDMTSEMFDFGIEIFKRFQKDLINGDVCGRAGCAYTRGSISAVAMKTKGGMASIMVNVHE